MSPDRPLYILNIFMGVLYNSLLWAYIGHCSSTGFVTNTTTCGAERISFQVCQQFVEEFETLYDGRNETKYPTPNRKSFRRLSATL